MDILKPIEVRDIHFCALVSSKKESNSIIESYCISNDIDYKGLDKDGKVNVRNRASRLYKKFKDHIKDKEVSFDIKTLYNCPTERINAVGDVCRKIYTDATGGVHGKISRADAKLFFNGMKLIGIINGQDAYTTSFNRAKGIYDAARIDRIKNTQSNRLKLEFTDDEEE